MQKFIMWVGFVWLLSGCGRLGTPTPEAKVVVEREPISATIPATPTVTSISPPTSTPRPATPPSSPTPTMTPTPVIYAVQSEDTLLSIALQFDISTELLQEANGLVDPRFLQRGQELIIPASKTEEEAAPTPTPTPLPLLIKAINFQKTQQGTLWGLGEVSNPGDTPLAEVMIEAALLDAGGVLLARETAYTQLDVILPGESVPFAILFENPPSSFAQYQVIPVTGVPLADQTRYYFDLEVFAVRGGPEGVLGYRLEGQLRNKGGLDVEAIRLVAVGYDEGGRVLAQRQAELAVTLLKAGAITPFAIDLTVPRGVVVDYKVLVQGLKVE